MSVQNPLVKGADQPVKGIAMICLAVLLFSSHDTLSKYLSAFYPIVMVVWARYVVHITRSSGAHRPLPMACSCLAWGQRKR
jgi:hypothetical protein